MSEPSLSHHPAFAQTYALLEELATAGADRGLSRSARQCLSAAFVELTDSGLHTPTIVPASPDVADAEEGFTILERLLTLMLDQATGLPAVLRLTRVRDLVTQARSSP